MVVGVKSDRQPRQALQQGARSGMDRTGRGAAGLFFVYDRPQAGRQSSTCLGITRTEFRAGRVDLGKQALAIQAHAGRGQNGAHLAAHACGVQVKVHQDAV